MKLKTKEADVIKLLSEICVSPVCVCARVGEGLKEIKRVTVVIYLLLSRYSLTCRGLPQSLQPCLIFLFHLC